MLGRFFGFCIFPGKCVAIRTVYTYTYGYRPKDGRHLHAPNSYLTDRFPYPSFLFLFSSGSCWIDGCDYTSIDSYPDLSITFFLFFFFWNFFPSQTSC